MVSAEPGVSAVAVRDTVRSRVRAAAAGADVAVVGAGLGGLATALLLAHRGFRVTVYERHRAVGGKMNRLSVDGYHFDTGPSLITMPAVFEDTFRLFGERLGDHVELVRVEPGCRYIFADAARIDVSSTLPQLLGALRSLGGVRDAAGVLDFLGMGARVLSLSERTFFRRSPWEPPSLRDIGAMTRPLPLEVLASYGKAVARRVRDPRLRQFLNRYATYVGSGPATTPAMLSVIPALECIHGAWHVRGGLYRLIEVLESLCERHGVVIRTHCEVEAIARDGVRVRGLRLAGGEECRADVVVLNGDASRIGRLLGRGGDLPIAARSLSGVVLLLSVPRRLDGWPHHQVLFSSDYDAEFRQLFEDHRFPDDPTIYINVPTRTDPTMAPPGCETVFVMANAPANGDGVSDVSCTEQARSRMLERLSRAGLWADLACGELRAELTPDWFAATFDMPGGAIYGTNAHGLRRAFLRPPNRVRGVRGLYCVGGSTHPGGGTPTVLMSARIVVDLIERHEHTWTS